MKTYRYRFKENSPSQEFFLLVLVSSCSGMDLVWHSTLTTLPCKIRIVIQLRQTRSFSYSNLGAIIGGGFSLYAGILSIVLSRQQVYVLKSLFTLVIIHLLFLLGTLFLSLNSAFSGVMQCESSDYECEGNRKNDYQVKILGILSTITLLILLLATIFNLVITIREWRARRRVDHVNTSRNSYLLLNIPLSLRENLRKTGFAYIALGGLMIGLDIGLLLNYPVR